MTPGGPQQTLDHDDIIAGLRELVTELHTRATSARIRIVGGAAIALTIDADRPSTVDIDAPFDPPEQIRTAAVAIAARHGWRPDWINDAAAMFLPSGLGTRTAGWRTVHQDDRTTIQIADPETLLAMKLHAAQQRGNRDAGDLAVLLPACSIGAVDAAESLYEAYYPGDGFTARTHRLVSSILSHHSPAPTPPQVPPLGQTPVE